MEIKNFIDEFFPNVYHASDFDLIDRWHEDESWIKAHENYNPDKPNIVNNTDISKEYQNILNKKELRL